MAPQREVLLVNPAEQAPSWPTMPRAVEPMGLLYVAGALEAAGATTSIIDLQLGVGDLRCALRSLRAGRFAGVGVALASQACLWNALALIQDARSAGPETPIFVGGVFASLNAQWLLKSCPGVDGVVVGEGEPFASQFAEEGWHPGLPGLETRDGAMMHSLPVQQFSVQISPSRVLTSAVVARGEAPSVVATRGCRGGCSFCCVSRYYGPSWLPRPAQEVRDDLVSLAAQFGSRRVHLVDDNLFGHTPNARTWIRELVDALREVPNPPGIKATCRVDDLELELVPSLEEAGFELLKVGIETFSDRAQRFYGKRIDQDAASAVLEELTKAGIGISLGFIMFDPFSTRDDLKANLDFLLRHPGTWGRHLLRSRLIAYRRTRIEERLQRMELTTSSGIMGSTWRFEDPAVAAVHDRFESALRAHVLPVEQALYDLQLRALRCGETPRRLPGAIESLNMAWVRLFNTALGGRANPDPKVLALLRDASEAITKGAGGLAS